MDSVRSKICSYIGVLMKIRHFVSVKTRLTVYYAHVHSQLCYLNVIWGTASVTKITELGRLQNKAIPYIFFEEYKSLCIHTSDLYLSHGIFDIRRLLRLRNDFADSYGLAWSD
jgi:hypothetical protein